MKKPLRLAIIGASGHGHVLLETIKKRVNEFEFIGWIDDQALPLDNYLGSIASTCSIQVAFNLDALALGIGQNQTRSEVFYKIQKDCPQIQWPKIIHPSAQVAKSSQLGEACYVGVNAIVQPRARVGQGSILNTRTIIEHDCTIGDFTHLAPACVLGGNTTIGNHCLLGIGSTIVQGIEIANHVIVGAGSVVTRSLDSNAIYAGIPAKFLNPNPR